MEKEKKERGSFEKARAQATQVLQRAVADADFREMLKKDPAAALEKAGIAGAAAEDLGREMVVDGVALSRYWHDCSWTCSWTCWWTGWLTRR